MRVVIAPDSYGGLLTAADAAAVIAEAWAGVRPDDEVILVPMSDGGTGFADVVQRDGDRRDVEVAGPRGLPVQATWWLDGDTAVIESAEACGLHLVSDDQQDPRLTTTWGVGQLLDDARRAGAVRILLGLGGSATVDGGAGALSGLGMRLTVGDGSGLKIGAEDLPRVRGASTGWIHPDWLGPGAPEVVLLADVTIMLVDSAHRFGPQKGADEDAVRHLETGLRAWADVADRDLATAGVAELPGSGAAGGLAFGLAAALPSARIVPGGQAVADRVGLPAAIAGADVVVTGEGRLDDASFAGKVIGEIARLAARSGALAIALVGEDRTTEAHGVVVSLLPRAHVPGDLELARLRLRMAATEAAGRT